jgi:hypothetical protein
LLLRLLTFRPDRAGDSADELLRRQMLPAMESVPGLRYLYAARASAAEGDRRVIASVWDDAAISPDLDLPQPFDFEVSAHAVDVEIEVHVLDIELAFRDAGTPQILRIFRGRTVPGELDNYVDHARHGTMADALADHGPEALFLARIPPDQFVTVSAWSAWDRIAASTGGNLRQPINTRHLELLEGGTATFYEIVPNTPYGRLDGAAASDEPTPDHDAELADPEKRGLLSAIPDLPAVAPGT